MKKFLAGFLAGALLMSGVTVMAKGGKAIEVFYTVKKLVIGGEEKSIDNRAKPFIYSGQAYIPLSYISDFLGMETKWNAQKGTITIGKGSAEEAYYWGLDLKASYNKGSVKYYENGKKIKDTYGDSYTNYLIALPYKESIVEFPLRGDYKTFKALLGTPQTYKSYNGASFTILVDGEEIFSQDVSPEDIPEEINIDLTGANKIAFKVSPNEGNGGVALFNGEFIK